jgi:TonB family protein
MRHPHPDPLRIAVAAVAACITIYAAAGESVEPASTQTEFSGRTADLSSSADIEAALARVNATRSRADTDPLALEGALTALGDVFLGGGQYATAEAAYAEALQLAEQHGGLDDERLLAPLLGLGNTLAESGRHEEAVPRLQRWLAIARAQYGLFDLRQQETLKTLAASLTALGRMQEAQDLMIYRVRVAEKAYGEGDPDVIPAMCDLGNWFGEVGKSFEARLTFQVTLNIASSKLPRNDLGFVEPLEGIARTHMRRQSYPESARRARVPPAFRTDATGKPIVADRKLDREGEHALKKALRILEADPRASTQARIETLIQMGDWYQIKKSPREATPYYQRAWQLIREVQGPSSSASALSFPVRVYYPTPSIVAHVPAQPPEQTKSHYVQIEFTVAADGSVSDARVLDHDTRDQYAHDILKAVRAARFRPRFVEGQAVATPEMTYREVFRTAKSRAD